MKIPQFLLFIMSAVTLNAETANFDADLAGEAPRGWTLTRRRRAGGK